MDAVKNYFEVEQQLVDYLSNVLGNCHVQGVNDYWDVLDLGPQLTETRAANKAGSILVFFGGEKVTDNGNGCGNARQLWHLAVCSKNLCELKYTMLARKENGEFVTLVLQAMNLLHNSKEGTAKQLKRETSPQFPIPERQGFASTIVSFSFSAPFI